MDSHPTPDPLGRIDPPPQPGDRLVVRHRLPDGSATDVVGWLERLDADRVLLSDRGGGPVDVARTEVLAARRAPAAPGGPAPARTSPDELERIALPAWLADSEPLGAWTLRAGSRFTGRANSCLAVGDPGVPLVEAARRIVAYAARHATHPWAQVVTGSEQEDGLRALGWTPVYDAVDVLVTRLGDLLGDSRPDAGVGVSEELTPDWLAAYHRSRPNTADPQVLRRILDGTPPRAFAGMARAGRLDAIGRGHVSAGWLGLASLWTDPDQRGRGWATRVLAALGHWGARRGAHNAYLQVATDNAAAHRAYERSGFVRHHGYRYLGPPGS